MTEDDTIKKFASKFLFMLDRNLLVSEDSRLFYDSLEGAL